MEVNDGARLIGLGRHVAKALDTPELGVFPPNLRQRWERLTQAIVRFAVFLPGRISPKGALGEQLEVGGHLLAQHLGLLRVSTIESVRIAHQPLFRGMVFVK